MRHVFVIAALLLSGVGLGCAANPPKADAPVACDHHASSAHDAHDAHEEAHAHPSAASTPSGAGVKAVALPSSAGQGEGREVKVLFEDGALKLASITLRAGTVLPEHTAPVPVSIHAISGSGVLVSGGERVALDAGQLVVLPAGAPHAVEPVAGGDLVILVHYLK